jgi:hypothetical protein
MVKEKYFQKTLMSPFDNYSPKTKQKTFGAIFFGNLSIYFF